MLLHNSNVFFSDIYNALLKVASKLDKNAPQKTKMILREMIANGIGIQYFHICVCIYFCIILSKDAHDLISLKILSISVELRLESWLEGVVAFK